MVAGVVTAVVFCPPGEAALCEREENLINKSCDLQQPTWLAGHSLAAHHHSQLHHGQQQLLPLVVQASYGSAFLL